MTWFVEGYYCKCGTKLSSNGRAWGIKKCAKCCRLDREAREAEK